LTDRLKKYASRLVQLLLPAIMVLQSLLSGCDDRAKWRGVATNNNNRDGAELRDTSTRGSANEPKR
jgi:hypothetical protein